MNRVRRAWVRFWCSHEWQVGAMQVEGATLGWTGGVYRQLGWHYQCSRCGSLKYDGGNYIPEDKMLHPECYGVDGWPIDPATGRKLEIVKA